VDCVRIIKNVDCVRIIIIALFNTTICNLQHKSSILMT